MPFPSTNYNFDYTNFYKNSINSAMGNAGLPQANNGPNYYSNILAAGYNTPNLSQAIRNMYTTPYIPAKTSAVVQNNSLWDRFLSLISNQNGKTSEKEGNKSLVSVAQSQLGLNEADKSYHKFTDGNNVKWCGAFVNWCLKKTNSVFAGGKENWSCDTLAKNILKKNPNAKVFDKNQGQTDTSKIKAGAVVFFSSKHSNKNYTHTGIVKEIKNGKIYTIEGNTSNKVAERSYNINDPKIQTIMNA